MPKEAGPGDEVFGRRLRTVKALRSSTPPRFVVAPIQAFLQPVPTTETLERSSRRIKVGDSSPVEELAAWLVEKGMSRVEVVEVAGEFSLRGGILDVFPPDASDPVRVEFFGDDVESIRPFDSETQRSLGKVELVDLTVAPRFDGDDPSSFGHAADAFPEGAWVALVEPNDLREEARHYLGRVDDRKGLFTLESTFARLIKLARALASIALSTLSATTRLSGTAASDRGRVELVLGRVE